MKQHNHAFSLIELSIVLLISSILISMGLTFFTNLAKQNNYLKTEEKINQVYQSLAVYLRDNKSIPCPASANISKTSSSYGKTSRNSSNNYRCDGTSLINNSSVSNVSFGIIPYKTLNIPEEYIYDGWGYPLTYIMIENCNTNSTENTTYNFSSDYCGLDTNNTNLIIQDISGNNINNKAVIVIMSHGQYHHGVFNLGTTSRTTNSTNLSSYMIENTHLSASGTEQSQNRIFISKKYNIKDFDNIFTYRTKQQLIAEAKLLDKNSSSICKLKDQYLPNISAAEIQKICGTASSTTDCEILLQNITQQIKDFCL